MTNTAISDLIAQNLGQLVHPGDGKHPATVLPLPMFRDTGLPPEMAEHFAKEAGFPSADVAKLVAEAIVHLIETEGATRMIPEGELAAMRTAAQAGTERYRQIALVCTLCGNPIIKRINIDVDSPTINGPYFLESLQKLSVACPHLPVEE